MPRPGPGPVRIDDGCWDVLADIHGCIDELTELLERLGWRPPTRIGQPWDPPAGRRLVVAGDVVDRGPDVASVLRTLMPLVEAGRALVTVGNHDDKLRRALTGRPVTVAHGLEASLEQLSREPASFRDEVRDFLTALPAHAILDRGRLVVAHAGLPESFHGSEADVARDLAMFGPTRPGRDQWGLPLRLDWAAAYSGTARIVFGHTPVVAPAWRNGTIDIDTGCVFGGALTAVRYPELELVAVPARREYQRKSSPFRLGHPGGPPVDPATVASRLQGRSGARVAWRSDDPRFSADEASGTGSAPAA